MYDCPNCGGNMLFDIPSQQLKCSHCDSLMDPYQYKYSASKDASDSELYEVTIFTCPQCGGEIMGSDTSAAEFCSYCGASTILHSRISNERKPGYIIPFQKTKEDCKQAYAALLKKAIFLPNDLKNPAYIDSFRGIYIPYWTYYIRQDGPISLDGEHSHRSGNYIYTDHYKLGGDLHAYYKGLSYDASSSFDDKISFDIAPFDVQGMKEFNPTILSGFYADTSDVDCNIYIEDAISFANENTADAIKKCYTGVDIKMPVGDVAMTNSFYTHCEAIDSAMFPVWFMSYRYKDRVAYSVINGQTGEAVADLPVDIKKYCLASLIMALPIFLIMNFLVTMKPATAMLLAAVLAVVTSIIQYTELKAIHDKDNKSYDKGYLYKRGELGQNRTESIVQPKKVKKPKDASSIIATIIIIAFTTGIWVIPAVIALADSPLLYLACAVISLIVMCMSFKYYGKIGKHRGFPTFIFSFAATLFSFFLAVTNPASDVWYYAVTVILLFLVVIANVSIINKYNILTTRKLPQFDRTGGDNRA